jgi:hypothetical protein
MDLLKQIFTELLNNEDIFDLEKLSTETQTPLIDLLKYKDCSLVISDTFINKFQNSFHDIKKMETVLKQPTEKAKIGFIKTLSNFNMKNAINNINIPKEQNSQAIKKESSRYKRSKRLTMLSYGTCGRRQPDRHF